jgi:hypothetical protein
MNELIEWLNKRIANEKNKHKTAVSTVIKVGKGGKIKQINDTLHFIETHYGKELKLFKCTIVCTGNSCYVETLLVVAENKEDAHQQIVDSKKDKYNKNPNIKYTQKLQEFNLDLSKKKVVEVGFAHNERDYGGDD